MQVKLMLSLNLLLRRKHPELMSPILFLLFERRWGMVFIAFLFYNGDYYALI